MISPIQLSRLVNLLYSALSKLIFWKRRLIIESGGHKFYLYKDSASPLLSIPLDSFLEKDEMDLLKSRIKKDWTVFDIGANFGRYTVHFSKLAKEVHAFEPIPSIFSRLKENIELNSCKNAVLNMEAVGKENGKTVLYIPADLGPSYASDKIYGKKITANIVTLDSYVKENNITRVDLIKADIEGGELNVLLGAEETLDRFHPDLFIEVYADHTRRFGYEPKDIFEFLKGKRYNIYHFKGNKLSELEDPGSPQGYNFYCTISSPSSRCSGE